MFSRWGAFVYRFRRFIVVATLLAGFGVAPLFAQKAPAELSQGGWMDPASESAMVDDHLATDFGAGRSTLIALIRSATGADATSPAFQAAIGETVAGLRDDPRVAGIVGYAETGDRRFISTKGDAAYVLVRLEATDEESVDEIDDLRSKFAPPVGYSVALTGFAPLQKDSNHQSEADLIQAEIVSIPIAALILVLVFGSLIAAGLPLLVAGLAIPTTLAFVYFVAQQVEMSIYVQNIATMLGLALAIDYSLFIVSRFREELARGRTVEVAVERAVATSGKAVMFSGIAVAIGLSGLLFFRASALSSIGIAGSLVVLSSVFYGLTFLPALLSMLGPRVNALSLNRLLRRLRARVFGQTATTTHGHSRWESVARRVMARPIAVLVPTLLFLLAAGAPFLRLEQGIPDASTLPPGLESRDALVAIQKEFPIGETTPIIVLAETQGDPRAHDTAIALARYAEILRALEGIERVESAFSVRDPATGRYLAPGEVAALWAIPEAQRPPQLAPVLAALEKQYIAGSTVRFDAISPFESAKPEATEMIPLVRALDPGPGITVTVGGAAAMGHDFLAGQNERLPFAVGMTLLASAVALFLLFGSLVLPIKAVIMTLLSISASFGALVWIFQEGNLSGLLDFQPLGYTLAGNPIIMFSVLFGLSMDYEVLLLSRVQEAYRRTGDNTASVAEGLARTAGVITGAALIMVAVFAAFALAQTITIKSIGVGMAIAVAIDATIIRVLVVPATMRLLGDWNWWAPGPLKQLADRLGFDHVETEDDLSKPAVGPAPASAG
jgi:RND superfamily putative drug exporter